MHHIVKRGFCLLALVLLTAGHAAMAEDLRIIGEDKAFVATLPSGESIDYAADDTLCEKQGLAAAFGSGARYRAGYRDRSLERHQ